MFRLLVFLVAQGVIFTNPSSTDLDKTAPIVTITSPTVGNSYDAGTSATLDLSGTSVDATGTATCSWSNSAGGSGTASTAGDGSWSVSSLSLAVGTNTLTVTCKDPGNNSGVDTLVVTRSSGGSGTEYFVDNSCANNGNGTLHTCASSPGGNGAWNALSSARGIAGNTCAAGDTIKIKVGSGPYISTNNGTDPSEDGGFFVTCTAAISGSPYTITAYDTANPPVIANCALGSTAYSSCDNVTFSKSTSVDYVTFSYLEVFGGFWLYGPTSTVEANLSRGIVIEHTEIYQGWGEVGDGNWSAIFLQGCYGAHIHHNNIHDIAITTGGGLQSSMAGIKMFTCTNSIYEYNTINTVGVGAAETQSGCIDDKQDAINNTYRYNLCLSVPHGIRIQNQTNANFPYNTAASGSVAEHNVFDIVNIAAGANCLRFANRGISSFTFRNNTCVGPFTGDAALVLFDEGGFATTGIRVYNNIVIGSTKHVAFYAGLTFTQLDYNIWDSATSNAFTFGGSNFSNLAAVVAGTAFEDHGFTATSASILFTNAAANNFTLQASSPAQGAGRTGGTTAGSVVDIGAYTDTVTCIGAGC